ncbi:MAG: hypothetical protein QM757_26005 [Paludibaculum sp.]
MRLFIAVDLSLTVAAPALETAQFLVESIGSEAWGCMAKSSGRIRLQVVGFAGQNGVGKKAGVRLNSNANTADYVELQKTLKRTAAAQRNRHPSTNDGSPSRGLHGDDLSRGLNVQSTDFGGLANEIQLFLAGPHNRPTQNFVWIISDGWHDPYNDNQPRNPYLDGLYARSGAAANAMSRDGEPSAARNPVPVLNEIALIYVDPSHPRWNWKEAKERWESEIAKVSESRRQAGWELDRLAFTFEWHSDDRAHLRRELVQRMLGLRSEGMLGLLDFQRPSFSCDTVPLTGQPRIVGDSLVYSEYSQDVKVAYKYWYPFSQSKLRRLSDPAQAGDEILPQHIPTTPYAAVRQWVMSRGEDRPAALYATYEVDSHNDVKGLPHCWRERRILLFKLSNSSSAETPIALTPGGVFWWSLPSREHPVSVDLRVERDDLPVSRRGRAALSYWRGEDAPGQNVLTVNCAAGSSATLTQRAETDKELPVQAPRTTIQGNANCSFWTKQPGSPTGPTLLTNPAYAISGESGPEVLNGRLRFIVLGPVITVVVIIHALWWPLFAIYLLLVTVIPGQMAKFLGSRAESTRWQGLRNRLVALGAKMFEPGTQSVLSGPARRRYSISFSIWLGLLIIAASTAWIHPGWREGLAFLWNSASLQIPRRLYIGAVVGSGLVLFLLPSRIRDSEVPGVLRKLSSVLRMGCYLLLGAMSGSPGIVVTVMLSFYLAADVCSKEYRDLVKHWKIGKVILEFFLPGSAP